MGVEIILSLLTLIGLEIVLGIDNIIFISILTSKLPARQQKKARRYGLVLAMFLRLALLSLISYIAHLKNDLFSIFDLGISGKDIILIVGGLFLLYKSSVEIYHKMEGSDGDKMKDYKINSFSRILIQILVMDMVFSLDSIITAVGLARALWIMYIAVIVSVGVMLFAAESISRFINNHPAFKMLALSFLLLIGFALVSEGFDINIPKGYIYFAMSFAFFVDVVQMRMNRKHSKPVKTHDHFQSDEDIFKQGPFI